MSSGMNMQEAKKVAEQMSYRQAVLNCLNARCVPFRKATKIKMKQLLESIDNDFADDLLNMGYTKGYQNGRADEQMLLGKAFRCLHGNEYSWSEVVEKAEQLKEREA